ncbi:unnamed protein product, partial [Laminaria digitata]
KSAAYCKKHAEDSMVDVYKKRCLHNTCMRQPSFNVAGSQLPLYCKPHAEEGMVNVKKTRC